MVTYKEELIKAIEYFYTDIIEGYKEVQQEILRETKIMKIFKKVDYDQRLAMFKKYKHMALDIDVKCMKIDKNDEESVNLEGRFLRCLSLFNALCDAHIRMQTALKNKAQAGKNDFKMSEYKEIMDLVRRNNMAMQMALHELDVAYTDYTEEDD